MEDVEFFCCPFKLLQEIGDLDISFALSTCCKHERQKTIIYLNFDDDKNIDINSERKKFEEYVEQSSSKDGGWFAKPYFRKCKIEKERRHFKFENIVGFVLMRDFSII